MNSGEELYNKIFGSPLSPQRFVFKPALHDGRQDTASIEERASTAHSKQCRETCSGDIDYWIQGLLHHTVQQEDHTRREAVKRLIQQFETHPKREAWKADLRQNYAYNPFSEKSKDMMEHIEMCEISPKIQCFHCLTYWMKGIENCTCGACFRPTDNTRKLNRDRFDAFSIPNYVIQKGPSHSARLGNTERTNLSRSSRRGQKANEKGYVIMFVRIQNCPIYRASQIEIGWDEEFCASYDAIAK